MKQKLKFAAMCLITLSLALADGALTWLNTPDLQDEANPLVSVLGLGWAALFTVNLIFYALYVWMAYFLFLQYKAPVLRVTDRRAYISQLYYNRPDKFSWFFYKLPKNWRPVVAITAFAYIYTAPAARAVLVFQWSLVTFNIKWPFYSRLRRMMPFHRVDLALAMVLIVFLFLYWLEREYRKNQRAWKAEQGREEGKPQNQNTEAAQPGKTA